MAFIDDNGNCCVLFGQGRCQGRTAAVVMTMNRPGCGYLLDDADNVLSWFGPGERYPDWESAVVECGLFRG